MLLPHSFRVTEIDKMQRATLISLKDGAVPLKKKSLMTNCDPIQQANCMTPSHHQQMTAPCHQMIAPCHQMIAPRHHPATVPHPVTARHHHPVIAPHHHPVTARHHHPVIAPHHQPMTTPHHHLMKTLCHHHPTKSPKTHKKEDSNKFSIRVQIRRLANWCQQLCKQTTG